MKKQILALSLIQGLVLQPLMADNLNQYREGILRPLQTSQAQSLERAQALRSELGTISARQISVESKLGGADAKHQLYSSIILKNILQNGVEQVMQARQYNTRIPLDPTWSQEEHRQIMALEDRKVCVSAILNSRKDAAGKAVGISEVVTEIFSKATAGQNNGLQTTTLANNDVNAGAQIASHLESGPASAEGLSILGTLGAVNETEIIDGLVHRVTFLKDGQIVPLSLPVILTYRMGEDDAFVQTQDCLLEYLKDQRTVFKTRLAQKSDVGLLAAFNNAYNAMINAWNQVSKAKYNVSMSSDDKGRAEAEVREMYSMIQTTDPAAQLLAKLKYFSEGNNFTNRSRAETDFMTQRIALANLVIPFLESRGQMAHATNAALKKLSFAQVNYVTDMFLQLRAKDLPTAQDMSGMGEIFASAALNVAADQKQLDRLNADSMYYQVIGKQLTSLERHIVQERDNAQAKQRDLEQLRR